eukprot:365803-Chlamydomonas_euryale.AAC.17
MEVRGRLWEEPPQRRRAWAPLRRPLPLADPSQTPRPPASRSPPSRQGCPWLAAHAGRVEHGLRHLLSFQTTMV